MMLNLKIKSPEKIEDRPGRIDIARERYLVCPIEIFILIKHFLPFMIWRKDHANVCTNYYR